jgi:hypothetical protein
MLNDFPRAYTTHTGWVGTDQRGGSGANSRFVRRKDDIKFVLHTRKEAAEFYASVGFAPATDMMIRDRRC